MSDFGSIKYSSAMVRPIKNLLAEIEMEENGFAVRTVGETTANLEEGVAIKR
jgi:hypothetical protein